MPDDNEQKPLDETPRPPEPSEGNAASADTDTVPPSSEDAPAPSQDAPTADALPSEGPGQAQDTESEPTASEKKPLLSFLPPNVQTVLAKIVERIKTIAIIAKDVAVDIGLSSRDLVKKLIEYQKIGVLVMWKNREYSMEVKADFAQLKGLRTFVSKYGRRGGLLPKQAHNVQLVLDEVATNIIRHAYKDMPEQGNIRVAVVRREKAVEVIVSDSGVEFDWNKVLDPDLEKYVEVKRKGGLGIMLIRKLTNKAEYARVGDRNVVTLTFDLALAEKKRIIAQFWENVKTQTATTAKVGAVGFALATVLGITVFLVIGYFQRGTAEAALFVKGIDAAKNIAANSALAVADGDSLTLSETVATTKEQIQGISYITVVDKKRIIVADTADRTFEKYKEPSEVKPLGTREKAIQPYRTPKGETVFDVAVPVMLNKKNVGEVHIGISQNSIDVAERMASFRLRAIFITIAIWIFALGIVGILVAVFINPIRRFSQELAKVGSSGFSLDNLSTGTLSEFKEIGNAFAGMVGRMKDQEAMLTDQTRIKKEMQLAKDIQNTLLPKVIPQTEGFEIAGNYRSALEMGGDYYDFFPVMKNVLGLVVGDVSGKGIGAAFIMAMCRMTMRIESKNIRRAADVLTRINSYLAGDIKKGMYITVFYAILDSDRHTINYASAGHNPMILYRAAEQKMYFLNPKGFAVGLQLPSDDLFKKSIKSEVITLTRGDLVFIYTDGITEAMDTDRNQYGEPRLVEFIKNHHHLSTEEFSKALDADIEAFCRGYPQSDDITYIVVKAKKTLEEVKYERVVHMYELINGGMTATEAAEKCGFSFDEFRSINARYKRKGIDAFKPKEKEIVDTTIAHATLEQTRKMLMIIREHPEYGTARIRQLLATEAFGNEDIAESVIMRELKKQKLATRSQRDRFAKRKMSDFSALTAGLASMPAPAPAPKPAVQEEAPASADAGGTESASEASADAGAAAETTDAASGTEETQKTDGGSNT